MMLFKEEIKAHRISALMRTFAVGGETAIIIKAGVEWT